MTFPDAPVTFSVHWAENFESLQTILKQRISFPVEAYHIGSTAVAGLSAKPVLDVLLVVEDGKLIDLNAPLTALGFESKGEFGIPGRSYFRKATIHIHAFSQGHDEIKKHLAFRDYLRSHDAVRVEYDQLKNKLIAIPDMDKATYQEMKSAFITQTTSRALAWKATRPLYETAVKKVVCYIFRRKQVGYELLVFDHLKFPEVNPQVPAGTVEKDELTIMAARRELKEESGLDTEKLFYLGQYTYYKEYNDQFQQRYHYALIKNDLAESWIHKVQGAGVDADLEFNYYWMPIDLAEKKLQVKLGAGLDYFQPLILSMMEDT